LIISSIDSSNHQLHSLGSGLGAGVVCSAAVVRREYLLTPVRDLNRIRKSAIAASSQLSEFAEKVTIVNCGGFPLPDGTATNDVNDLSVAGVNTSDLFWR
jgi:hypothetical protein